MAKYLVQIKGTRPLLMHSPASIGRGRGRGEIPDPIEEAERALYKHNDTIIIPAHCIKATLREAGKDFLMGGKGKRSYSKYILSGLEINPIYIPLEYDSWVVDTRPVVIQRQRILRARPRFDNWGLTFELNIIDPLLEGRAMRDILEAAGKYKGLLDFRPEYGLFKVEKFEQIGE